MQNLELMAEMSATPNDESKENVISAQLDDIELETLQQFRKSYEDISDSLKSLDGSAQDDEKIKGEEMLNVSFIGLIIL